MSQFIQTPPPQYSHQTPPPIQPKRHGLALPVFLLGLIGLLFFPLAFIALVLGVVCLIGIKSSRGLKTGKGLAITGTALAVISLAIVAFIAQNVADAEPLATGKAVTPEATLAIAEANIMTANKGVAYSNSQEGLAMAKRFSELFKDFSEEATDALSERHEFVTHCQIHDDSVAFLVHVPKLRKFDKESKERFCETAWQLAGLVLTESQAVPVGTDLAVGVKGNLLYQNIYFGKFEIPIEEEPQGVEAMNKDQAKLEKFFKGIPLEEDIESDESIIDVDSEAA